MFQFPLSGGAVAGAAGAPATEGGLERLGIQGLLQTGDGLEAGFSAELQSLLMQMSPQMFRRLEELLAGGMDLPQAASRLLSEARLGAPEGTFAGMLNSGTMGDLEGEAVVAMTRLETPGTLKPLADALQGMPKTPNELLQSLTALGAGTPLAMMSSAQPGAQMSPQLASNLLGMGVPQQVGDKGWANAIADRLMWMVQGDQQSARLKLNPPNLGPLEVRVSINQEQASVSFLANHAAVRDALEAALPRLREMFDQQSIQLVRADVSDPGAQQGDRAGDSSARSGRGEGPDDGLGGDETMLALDGLESGPVSVGLVDLFA